MADHRVYCHLCGRLGIDGPTRVRAMLVFTFCGRRHNHAPSGVRGADEPRQRASKRITTCAQ